ncbi:MAG: Inner membrane protein YjdF [Verrucomicrobiae bacterium]|nr:Inner membrane protein YjdF [Verrucomicrobiae bacterium]
MIPAALLLLYLIEFTVLAINPYDRGVWFAENLPILLIVITLVGTYRRFRFSDCAYLLMSPLIFLHTYGGHYTFERVPFDWFTNLIGAERNHYDRLAHFTVGFYAFAIAEFIEQKQLSRSRWLTGFFAVFAIGTLALGYEIFEWRYAVHANPAAGIAVLGSQGDIWDAQKDMLADTLGAICATLFYFIKPAADAGRSSAEPPA